MKEDSYVDVKVIEAMQKTRSVYADSIAGVKEDIPDHFKSIISVFLRLPKI